jgi:pimeloyl-ACP methyl ester carboxylesterase
MPSEPKARAALARNMVARMAATPPEAWQKQQLATMKSMVSDAERAAQLATLCGAVPTATSARYMGEMMLSDLRARLTDAKVPVLAISAVASDMGEAFAKAIRGGVAAQFAKASPQVTLAPFDCRHFVMDDEPAELDAAVAAFVAKLAAAK